MVTAFMKKGIVSDYLFDFGVYFFYELFFVTSPYRRDRIYIVSKLP